MNRGYENVIGDLHYFTTLRFDATGTIHCFGPYYVLFPVWVILTRKTTPRVVGKKRMTPEIQPENPPEITTEPCSFFVSDNHLRSFSWNSSIFTRALFRGILTRNQS
ncbi:hypothetical protein HanXRQr2_Chr12g0533941 [Helianthus annuus]|uniref:Uncharacterized protein n=1 Tax=Helianthus annuus TaxID=4232 RepID=A0A9K3MVE5_HELAN|nr:hypothetical protein HanXRQr2_Chr12g0533941 [Helianthus annuus]KAJ0862098.1 hypothetical protein HanPSC8_Chr12g0514211 [Helianthus annuus]